MHCLLTLFTCYCLIAIHLQQAEGALAARILPPLSFNAYFGQPNQDVFECLLWDQRFIRWNINGERISPEITASTGIRIMNIPHTKNPTHSLLVIPTTEINSHGIAVQCVAIPTHGLEVTSNETGYFNIQGLLNMSQSHVLTTSYNRSYNRIEWDKPFTLNITNIEPDIYGYTVCTAIDVYMPEVCENVTGTETSFLIPKHSIEVQVRIFANNIVGTSEPLLYSINPCSDFSIEFDGLASVSFQTNGTEVTLLIVEPKRNIEICYHLFNISIYHHKSGSVTFKTTLFASNKITLHPILQQNTHYTIFIEFANHILYHQTNFSTFDIQNTTVRKQNGTIIVIECQFAEGSTALGFYTEVELTKGDVLPRNVSLSDSCQASSEGQECILTTTFDLSEIMQFGNTSVHVSVYDWEADGTVSTVVYQGNFTIIEQSRVVTRAEGTDMVTIPHEYQPSNDSDYRSTIPITTVGAAAGGALLVVMIGLSIAIVTVLLVNNKVSRARAKQDSVVIYDEPDSKPSQTPVKDLSLTLNESYALALRTRRNEPYGNISNQTSDNQPHVYDEIEAAHNPDPEYAEIKDLNTTQMLS